MAWVGFGSGDVEFGHRKMANGRIIVTVISTFSDNRNTQREHRLLNHPANISTKSAVITTNAERKSYFGRGSSFLSSRHNMYTFCVDMLMFYCVD